VVVRYRSTHGDGNLVEKGQAASSGGQVKLEQVSGRLSCQFKTSSGAATTGAGSVRMRLARHLANPVVGWLLFVGTVLVSHRPVVYDFALNRAAVHNYIEHPLYLRGERPRRAS
jgi:Cytochrome c oxidase caa3 assembly factor (Caa3_CtaG)